MFTPRLCDYCRAPGRWQFPAGPVLYLSGVRWEDSLLVIWRIAPSMPLLPTQHRVDHPERLSRTSGKVAPVSAAGAGTSSCGRWIVRPGDRGGRKSVSNNQGPTHYWDSECADVGGSDR